MSVCRAFPFVQFPLEKDSRKVYNYSTNKELNDFLFFMDVISHILIGRGIATPSGIPKRNVYFITFFSFLPDLPQIAIYLYLGFINSRPFFMPLNTDWNGFRALHPLWSAIWEIPHSIFFALLIILPVILIFRLPKMALVVYLLHIFIDLFTHTGEWGTKIFYPLHYKIDGFTNAWSWSFINIFSSWIILTLTIVILHSFFRYKTSTNKT
ncbi:MAG: hypothetical protein UT53_C0010G0016 [Candidatus Yanofskybacteria bacterium GW2011_GWD2_39_48]|uniref:Membrane-bound metal-dependent hydrolase n=1 Tax=Candidatus Yanofskybacteria bacterium GW2011_GWD2_39_48 TaxID=1619031 RepID=A0A0G0SDC7_9BACT|nr:MAG: hypothetical protein UT53_C0010G0016 [Candidatus Yanofskybacteria bacterium GW2011_GWD2_39_48]